MKKPDVPPIRDAALQAVAGVSQRIRSALDNIEAVHAASTPYAIHSALKSAMRDLADATRLAKAADVLLTASLPPRAEKM